MTEDKDIDGITGQIVDAAVKIHTRLGPGLLESVYEAVLARYWSAGDWQSCGKSLSLSNLTECGLRKDFAPTCWWKHLWLWS